MTSKGWSLLLTDWALSSGSNHSNLDERMAILMESMYSPNLSRTATLFISWLNKDWDIKKNLPTSSESTWPSDYLASPSQYCLCSVFMWKTIILKIWDNFEKSNYTFSSQNLSFIFLAYYFHVLHQLWIVRWCRPRNLTFCAKQTRNTA